MTETTQVTHTPQSVTVFTNRKDFIPFGIEYLTGESCGYGLRGLFDLNTEGVKYLREFFSLTDNCFQPPWNHESTIGRHVASILIGHRQERDIAVYLLLKFHLHVFVIEATGEIIAVDTDEEVDRIRGVYGSKIWHYTNNDGASRNQHAMSGRVE